MNKYISFSLFAIFFSLLTACQSKKDVKSIPQQNDTTAVQSANAPVRQEVPNYSTAIKGKIESVREVPVYSRMAEQIVMFAIENTGQYVKKGQVVARLSDVALREKIAHARAKLEKAEFQYQAILMGQGYKHNNLDAAPDNIKHMARISSGYNEAKAELHALESEPGLLYHHSPRFRSSHENPEYALWCCHARRTSLLYCGYRTPEGKF